MANALTDASGPRSLDAQNSSGHFPSPWSVEERLAAFVVCDHGGQPPAYVFFEESAPWRQVGRAILMGLFWVWGRLAGRKQRILRNCSLHGESADIGELSSIIRLPEGIR